MLRTLLLKILGTKVYAWLLLRIIPFIRFSTYYADMRGASYHAGYALLKPGHILVSVDRRKLTSLLVPGLTTHAALCLAKHPSPLGYEVAEMTHSNYTRSHFFDICKEADRVLIVECEAWDPDYTHEVIEACKTLASCRYDLEFSLGVEALYCSELVYQSDRLAAYRVNEAPKLHVDLRDIHSLGTQYISPDGLLTAHNVRCVWDSEGQFSGMSGPEIDIRLPRPRKIPLISSWRSSLNIKNLILRDLGAK